MHSMALSDGSALLRAATKHALLLGAVRQCGCVARPLRQVHMGPPPSRVCTRVRIP